MRNYDFSPFGRHSVGFDHLLDLINQTAKTEADDSYPPYDIIRTGPDSFRVSMALAGFDPSDLSVTAERNVLIVAGRQTENGDKDYLYRGIAGRAFERKFSLGDYVEVESAATDNGMLHIDLVRRVPDAMKPRTISIGTGLAGKASTRDRKVA